MFTVFATMLADDDGQGLVEYALVLALVSIVAITALRMLGTAAKTSLNSAAGGMVVTGS